MGMYDNVDYETTCPKCKSKVSGFQTKSLGCTLDTASPLEAGNFYTMCDKCGIWIDVYVKFLTGSSVGDIKLTAKDKKGKIYKKTERINIPKEVEKYGRIYVLKEEE